MIRCIGGPDSVDVPNWDPRLTRWTLLVLLVMVLPSGLARLANLVEVSRPPVVAPRAMSGPAVERLLQRAPATAGMTRLRCGPGASRWDYVCLYRDERTTPAPWMKLGVRVNSAGIVQASAPHRIGALLPEP